MRHLTAGVSLPRLADAPGQQARPGSATDRSPAPLNLNRPDKEAMNSTATTLDNHSPQAHRANPALTATFGVVFFAAYYLMSMRKQKPTTLGATKLGPISYDIAHFGAVWFWGNVALDAALAVMSAIGLAWTIRELRARRAAGAGIAGGAGGLALAFATFGCPTCTLPLAGTLGVGVFASGLPLAGTEFKLIAAIPLALSLYAMSKASKRASCAI